MPPDNQPSSPQQPDTASARLPEYHVLGSITDAKPGTIPLLFRMPDGNREQLHVPLHSTVDDIASYLQKDSNDVYRLSFGNSDLDPTTSLLDTNIVDAYEHAGSLLHLIATGRQDADTKAAALDSACAVVETISNGIKDMEALCAAAMPDTDQPPLSDPPVESHHPPHASPSQLAYNLSRRLPNLFPNGTTPSNPSTEYPDQPTLGRQVTAQPSISNIRDARRRASALRKAHGDQPTSKSQDQFPDIAIGESTNVPLPLNLDQPSTTNQREPTTSLMLANSGKTTWLEDIMKTWEVDAVRDSGVLEKSKDGQEISRYLQSLEHEAERDAEIEKIENVSHSAQNPIASAPGDSSDDDETSIEQHGSTQQQPSASSDPIPNGQTPSSNGHEQACNATEELQRSIAAVNISGRTGPNPAAQMLVAQSAASAAVMEGSTTPFLPKHSMQPAKQHQPCIASHSRFQLEEQRQNLSQPQSGPSSAHTTLPTQHKLRGPALSSTPPPVTPQGNSSSSEATSRQADGSQVLSSDTKNKPPLRQATKIAPAPSVATSPITGTNGLFPNQMYPGMMPVSNVPWQSKPVVPGQKKRGRKRKNPELTDEERALVRKEQNRESAKLSRVRRKVIAAEYEGRLNALVEENTMLRKQVEGLNNRLVYLQSLLTISVRQEAPPP